VEATLDKISAKEKFLSQFIGLEITPENEYLLKVRGEAQEALNSLEFPTTKDEYWKYTRIGKILKGTYSQTPSFGVSDVEKFKIEGLEVNLLVFINGFFSEELSEISEKENIVIQPLAKARKSHSDIIEKYFAKYTDHNKQIFTALNTVYHTSGTFVYSKENAAIEKPIHIINITNAESAAFNPRNLFIVGKNSEVKIISSYETIRGSSFTNSVTEIILHENAHLSQYLLQNESENSSQINTTEVYQESNSNFNIHTITTNGLLVRNNLNISLEGEHIETHLSGLHLTKGKQHVDNHTFVDHRQPNCQSNELYKGIMNGKSTGVFNGKVMVRPHAQKTNAYQSNQNILLTDDASINSKPELEIYADDVKCSHGSTTGQLDEEAKFYLRSRGLSEDSATKLLLNAFAEEVLRGIKLLPLREKIEKYIEERYENIVAK